MREGRLDSNIEELGERGQVRKRVRVTGEQGVVLHGAWTMDSSVGGGSFENVTCITSCGQGEIVICGPIQMFLGSPAWLVI